MRIYDYGKNVFVSPPFPDDEKNRIAGIVKTCATAIITALCAILFYRLMFGQYNKMPALLIAFGISLISLLLNRRGKVAWSASVLSWGMLGFLLTHIVFSEGVHDTALFVLPGLFVLAGMVLKRKHSIYFTIASVLSLVVIGFLDINGILQKNYSGTTIADILDIVIIISITAVTIRLLADHLVESLVKARENERKYRTLFESNKDGISIFYIFEDGTVSPIIIANNAAAEMVGHDLHDFIGRDTAEFEIHIDEENLRLRREAVKSAGSFKFETILQHKNGKKINVEIDILSIEYNNRPAVMNIVRDITEHKRIKEEIEANERKYRFMFYDHPQPMWIFDLETLEFLEVNRAAMVHYGYSKEEFLSMTIKDIRPSADIPALLIDIDRDDKRPVTTDIWKHIKKNGEEIIVEITAHSMIFNGRISRHIIVNDITERKRIEDKLKESETRFSLFMDYLPALVFIKDNKGRTLYANKAMDMAFGASKWIGLSIPEIFNAEAAARIVADDERTIQLGYQKIFESFTVLDGSVHHYETQKFVIPHQGHDPYLGGIAYDITERRKTEEALKSSLSLLNASLESTADGILIVNREGKIIKWNHRFAEMWSIPAEILNSFDDDSVISHIITQLSHPKQFVEKVSELYARPEETCFDQIDFLDGRVFERYSQPHTVEEKTVGRVWSFRNVTERRQMEESIRHRQKMESIGTLAGGIAHDFNNLLNAMMGNISLAKMRIASDHPAMINLERTLSAMERAALLTKQMLAYSGKGRFQTLTVDLAAFVQEHLGLLEVALPKNVKLHTNIPPSPVYVKCDPAQMEQIVMNLIINGGESIGEKQGVVTITVSSVTISGDETKLYGTLSDQELEKGVYVLFQISDNGSGMNHETLSKIFDPFFTTKFVGRGLGLSAVLGIIRGHKGGIIVESEEGSGTTFRVVLPLASAPDSLETVPVRQPAILPAKTLSVLVIDDEKDVLDTIKDILESGNYRPIVHVDPVSALAAYEKLSNFISLVILDLSMPGMHGEEVLVRLQKINPAVKVILSSGYAKEEAQRRLGDVTATAFIQKPYQAGELLLVVSDVLGMV